MRKGFMFIAVIVLIILTLVAILSIDAKKTVKKELTISAAASLQDALYEVKNIFENENPDISLNFNFGSSGTLQKQIAQGAPVDLFFSESEKQFAPLLESGEINQQDSIILLENELVLVVPKGKSKSEQLDELNVVQSIAIGIPESVPAGKYAVEFLQNQGIWNKVKENIVYVKDVRQVLTYVESGNVEAGIVYKTDILNSEAIDIVATINKNLHSPIVYPVGILKNSKHYKEALEFYLFLQTGEIKKVFERYGFTAN